MALKILDQRVIPPSSSYSHIRAVLIRFRSLSLRTSFRYNLLLLFQLAVSEAHYLLRAMWASVTNYCLHGNYCLGRRMDAPIQARV